MDRPSQAESSMLRAGAFAAHSAGLLMLAAAVTYLLLPTEQRVGVAGGEILPSVAAGAAILRVEFVLLALVGIAGLGLVPALVRLVDEGSPGFVRWAGTIATVGYAVTAVSYFYALGRLPAVAERFVGGEDATQEALLAVWRSSIDLQGYWQLVAVGVFVAVVSAFALRLGRLPTLLCYLGFLFALLSLVAAIGSEMRVPGFLDWIVGLAVVVAPAWYIWVGLELGRLARPQ